jgi:DNA mismatch endonuclease (patch repair protein)
MAEDRSNTASAHHRTARWDGLVEQSDDVAVVRHPNRGRPLAFSVRRRPVAGPGASRVPVCTVQRSVTSGFETRQAPHFCPQQSQLGTVPMADSLSVHARSENMRRIRSKDTGPELRVRRSLHSAGLRYVLHRRGLPGQPDLVFPSRGICVFVHGCFWHGCPRCIDGTRAVKSNTAYWQNKVRRNKERDIQNLAALTRKGWRVISIWECEATDSSRLAHLLNEIRNAPIQPGRAQIDQTPRGGTGRREDAF